APPGGRGGRGAGDRPEARRDNLGSAAARGRDHARRYLGPDTRFPARPRRARLDAGPEGRIEERLSRDRRDGRAGPQAPRHHGRAGACLWLQSSGSGGRPIMAAPAIPTIAEAAKRIAAKQLSPVELTRACLDRVRALDDRLHAFVHLTEERALAEAREAERAIMAGASKGPLHGIPIDLKDIVDTKG